MDFDNLSIEIRAKQLGSFLRQPKKHIYSNAEIRCKNDRYRLRCRFNPFALLLRVACRSNDQRFPIPQRGETDFINAVDLTEVDCHVTISHRRFDRIAHIASRRDSRALSSRELDWAR